MALPGRAVVAAAGLETLGVKCLDRVMVGRAERDMRALALEALVQIEPQRRLALRAEARAVPVFRAEHEAERRKWCSVEPHAGVEIAGFDADMVVHDDLQNLARCHALEISQSVQAEAFLENLAHAPR